LRFGRKLILLLVLVAVVPVALSGVFSMRANQQEMIGRIGDFQKTAARLVAKGFDDFFTDAVRALKLSTRFIPFDQFAEADLPDALSIPYRQYEFVNVVVLLDQAGEQLTDAVYQDRKKDSKPFRARESFSARDVKAFGKHIPLKAALATGAAFGPAYFNEPTGTPRIALAIAFDVRDGKDRWVLAVELSLKEILVALSDVTPASGGSAYVVDGEGRVVCHPDRSRMKEHTLATSLAVVKEGLKTEVPQHRQYLSLDGLEVAGAFARIPSLGWGVVIEQPVKAAFAAARRIGWYTLFWVILSLVVAVFGGILFARGVSRPVQELSQGALELGKGDFDRTIPVRSKDEIGQLAETFNRMARDLKVSFEKIGEQNEEIRRWNQELQERVEVRTRELKQAQNQIVQSQKLAAVAELGAGAAHELNNPLTGIKGFLEIVLSRSELADATRTMLTKALEETRKIQEIVADLHRFSRASQTDERADMDVNAVLLDALRLAESQLKGRDIRVHRQLMDALPAVSGVPTDLQQVFLHLITNAKNAMPEGGDLRLTTSVIEGGAVKVSIGDTGRGIPADNLDKIFEPFFTTKDEWSGRGLGLSVASRIVEDHQGRISVESEEGKGTTFTMVFPGLRDKLHLA
jgi:two-component system, NtrC family, sensor kinase